MSTEAPPPAAAPATPPTDAPAQPTEAAVLGTLPLHLLAEPLRGQIEWIQRRHGLTPAAASLAVLATVLCVCGPSCRITNPMDARSLPPGLSVVFHGRPAAYVQAAVELGLDPVREWMLRRIGPPDKRQLSRARLRLGELHQERVAKEFHLNSCTTSSKTPDGEFGGALKGSELEAHRKTLEDEHARILREINNMTFLLRPHLMVDDAALPRLLAPGRLSTDGAVLHTSLGGHAVPAWTGANADTKAELARLLHLGWHGLPDAGDEDCHVRPLLSNVLVVDAAGARSLLSDRGLVAAGVIRHLFFLEASEGDAKFDLRAAHPQETAKLWNERLQALLNSRLAGSSVEHHLDSQATEVFEAFTRGLFDETRTSEPEEAHRLERTPVLALKLAVLTHAVSPDREQEAIGVKTIEFACVLAMAVSIGDLKFGSLAKPGVATAGAAAGGDAVTALVAKLRLRGSLRWRELLRSQRVHKAEPLEKLLAEALAAGLIRKDGDRYRAVDPGLAS